MFYRLFCFLFLATIGLNLVLSNLNLKVKAVEFQKPYISEVFKSDATLPDKCYEGKLISTYPQGLCHIDIWIEIANPTNNTLRLQGYKLNFLSNYSKFVEGFCAKESGLYCKPIDLSSYSIESNSQIVIKQRFGDNFIGSLDNGSASNSFENFLVHPNVNDNDSINFGFEDSDRVILESHTLIPNPNSIQFCKDSAGAITQSASIIPTPGQPNDCPKTERQIPILPNLDVEKKATVSNLLPNNVPEIELTKPLESKQTEIESPLPKVPENSNQIELPIQESTNPNLQPSQTQTILIPVVKIEPKPEVPNNQILGFEIKKQTEPITIENEKVIKHTFEADLPLAQRHIQAISQDNLQLEPTSNQSNLLEPKQEILISQNPIVELIPQVNQPILDNHIKIVSIKDEAQSQNFGKEIVKIATVDMYIVKSYFVYFNLILVLYLLSKTIVQNQSLTTTLGKMTDNKVAGQTK